MSDEELRELVSDQVGWLVRYTERDQEDDAQRTLEHLIGMIHSYGIEQRIDELKRLPISDFNDSGNAYEAVFKEDVGERIAELEVQRKEKE